MIIKKVLTPTTTSCESPFDLKKSTTDSISSTVILRACNKGHNGIFHFSLESYAILYRGKKWGKRVQNPLTYGLMGFFPPFVPNSEFLFVRMSSTRVMSALFEMPRLLK